MERSSNNYYEFMNRIETIEDAIDLSFESYSSALSHSYLSTFKFKKRNNIDELEKLFFWIRSLRSLKKNLNSSSYKSRYWKYLGSLKHESTYGLFGSKKTLFLKK